MEEETKSLGDYFDILRRRKYWIVFPAILLMMATTYVVLTMPATYLSKGVILIESQDIPQDLVQTTVTSFADQRIEMIRQRLMTTNRIMEIAEKHNLYPALRENSAATAPIVRMFSENVNVEIVQANVTDPASGRTQRASIAFEVSFMNESPQKAQRVADQLVTEFLSENIKQRTDRAQETADFLRLEGDRMQKEVQKTEKEIAEFRDEYSDSLPDLLDYNLSMVQATQQEIANIENQIMMMRDQVSTMGIQLSLLPKELVGEDARQVNQLSDAQLQLQELKAEYRAMQSRYSANHPDLQRTKRQIDSLESEVGIMPNSSRAEIQAQVTSARTNLQSLRQRYSAEHPDVKAAEAELARVENLLQELPNDGPLSGQASAGNSTNPAYIEVNAKMDATEREISRMRQRQQDLRERLANYEERVYKTNQVQRAYQDLTRDHENKLNQYKELRAKQLEAELAQTLETESKGESFILIEPPRVSDKPEKPNRPKLMVMGFVASIGSGVGLAILIELLFGGVRGYSQISRIVGKAPLVVIPVIATENDKQRKRRNRNRMIFGFLILICISIAVFHYYVMNLEVFWFKLLNKIG